MYGEASKVIKVARARGAQKPSIFANQVAVLDKGRNRYQHVNGNVNDELKRGRTRKREKVNGIIMVEPWKGGTYGVVVQGTTVGKVILVVC